MSEHIDLLQDSLDNIIDILSDVFQDVDTDEISEAVKGIIDWSDHSLCMDSLIDNLKDLFPGHSEEQLNALKDILSDDLTMELPSIKESDSLLNSLFEESDISPIDDFSFHVQQANDALNTVEYLQKAEAQAVFDDQLYQIDMERISKPLETQERYQEELNEIISSHDSNLSFQGGQTNRWDDKTTEFLEECRKYGIELPYSVDHSFDENTYVVDRDPRGGLKSVDKTIIHNTLKTELEKGKITEDVYKELDNKLYKC